jgi:hypothetical protein
MPQPSDMLWLKLINSSTHDNAPVQFAICTYDYYYNAKSQRQTKAVMTLQNYG